MGPGSQDPEDGIEDTAVIHPWNTTRLIRQERLDGRPLKIGEFVAHDSGLQFGSLNHAPGGIINPSRPVMVNLHCNERREALTHSPHLRASQGRRNVKT